MVKRTTTVGGWFLGLGLLTASCANAPPAEHPGSILPLRTVRLYETGVGYFERTGTVSPTSGASLPVPAAHLDDALKTLVVVSAGGQSSVDGLEFESSVTEGMARALAGLPKEAQTKLTYMQVLSSLKGEDVAVRTRAGTFEGRVIDVLEPPPESVAISTDDEQEEKSDDEISPKKRIEEKPEKRPELMLLLLTQGNEIRQFPSTEIEAVRPASPVTEARLGLALNALSARAPQSRRMVRVIAHAKGPVSLGYVAETPLWRTTYRMVLSEDKPEGMLQGWALLHNDTDEDWSQVRVQLVNGQPDSFLFPLAAPRYGRRELLTPEQDLSTIPQLLDQTPDGIWGDHTDPSQGTESGYGSGHGRMASSHRSRPPSVRMGATTRGGYYSGVSDLLSIGNLAEVQQAAGVESAALFIYTLPRPLDLRAHGSALVPFVQAPVSAARVTWIDGSSDPRMGVLFTNLTNQTLPPGPIAFFSEGGFAGESALERLKPEERRYLVYGVDIDVEVSKEQVSTTNETRRLEFKDNELHEHYVRRETAKYTIENRSGQPRAVHWPIKVVANSKVEGADEVRFDEGEAIAVFQIPARKKVERMLHTTQGLTSYTPMSSLSSSKLERLSTKEPIPEDQRKVVLEALEKRRKIEQTNAQLEEVRAEMERLEKDVERFREHLKALGGETGGVAANPFVKRIMDGEDRLEAARTKERALKDRSDTEQGAVRDALMPLKVEERKPAD